MTSAAPKRVIALTGSIGSGKTTAAGFLADLGARVVEADILAREVVAPGSDGLKKLVAAFGTTILKGSGLDRAKLAEIVFAMPEKRAVLESILHPLIRERWLSTVSDYRSSGESAPLVYVVPLYFESQSGFPEIDTVVTVAADEKLFLERAAARDGTSVESTEKRYKAQLPLSQKIAASDHVIWNSGSMEDLRDQVQRLYNVLIHQQ